jgi:hypothetical protein
MNVPSIQNPKDPCCEPLQVPTILGPLAQQNVRVYQRYAAVQQVLSLGHRCVSVQPELLLLSDPLPLLAHHPADVSVMSTAWGDENMAYGEAWHSM